MFTSVITGDIINSRKLTNAVWQSALKGLFSQFGEEPGVWEIYRGDSFQIEIEPEEALKLAILIKAAIRQHKPLDVRMGIGIGSKDHSADKVTQSTGSAFIHSGECFEQLEKKTLAVRSLWPQFDKEVNLYLALALLTINRWSEKASALIKLVIENEDVTQTELEEMAGKSQATISENLTRAGFKEIMQMEKRYRELIRNL